MKEKQCEIQGPSDSQAEMKEGQITWETTEKQLSPSDKHRDMVRKIIGSLDRINDPKTETDYLEKLNFILLIVTNMATAEYRTWWAGIIEIWTKIDYSKVDVNLTKTLGAINSEVQEICNLFNVEHPTNTKTSENKRSFKEWYESNSKKLWKNNPYPEYIFEKLLQVFLSSNTK